MKIKMYLVKQILDLFKKMYYIYRLNNKIWQD